MAIFRTSPKPAAPPAKPAAPPAKMPSSQGRNQVPANTTTIEIQNIMTAAPAGPSVVLTAAVQNIDQLPSGYQVHWTWSGLANITVIAGQDGPLTDTADGEGNYYASIVLSSNAIPANFTAHLVTRDAPTVDVATSTALSVAFKFDVIEPLFTASDKYFIRAGSDPRDDNRRVRAWLSVFESNGDPVAGIEFKFTSAPDYRSTQDIHFYSYPGELPEGGPPKPSVKADTVEGWPVVITNDEGLAEVWITSTGTHALQLTALMNGGTNPTQVEFVVVSTDTPVNVTMSPPTINGNLTPEGLVPDPSSYDYSIQLSPDGVTPQPATNDTVIVVIAWYTDLITGDWEYVATDVAAKTNWGAIQNNPLLLLPYANLMTQDEADSDPLPVGDQHRRNRIMWFVQNQAGVSQAGLSTSFNLAGSPQNIPNPDPSLNRILQECYISPYPGTGYITDDLLELNNGQLTMNIPKVPAAYDQGAITAYLYINGYWPGTRSPRRGIHQLTGEQASKDNPVPVQIPQALLDGFAVSTNNDIGRAFFDYKVQGPSDAAYGQYPHGYKMST